MSSKYNYVGELVLVRNIRIPSRYWTHLTKEEYEKTYLGVVTNQFGRMEVQVKILSSDWPGGYPRAKNVRNPPLFETDPRNEFHVLNEKKGRDSV